jgi:hypothetical protein
MQEKGSEQSGKADNGSKRAAAGGSSDHGVTQLAQNTGQIVKDLTLAVLTDPKTPWYAKGPALLGAIAALLIVIFGVIFAFSDPGKVVYGFWLCLSGVLLLGLVVGGQFWITVTGMRTLEARPVPSPPSPRPDPTWTRIVPKIPIREEVLGDIRDRLESIRNAACDKVEARGIKREHIRANIFLLDTGTASEGTCELFIPKKLHVGMEASRTRNAAAAERERNIRFKPNQGATGVAFIENLCEIARVGKAGDGKYDWPEKYSLTDTQKHAIHPDLKWVISFPLNAPDGNRARSMGVLNVDGLVHELEEEDLKILVGELVERVAVICGVLAKEERSRISLVVEDV